MRVEAISALGEVHDKLGHVAAVKAIPEPRPGTPPGYEQVVQLLVVAAQLNQDS
jgi:hypothetical protein